MSLTKNISKIKRKFKSEKLNLFCRWLPDVVGCRSFYGAGAAVTCARKMRLEALHATEDISSAKPVTGGDAAFIIAGTLENIFFAGAAFSPD